MKSVAWNEPGAAPALRAPVAEARNLLPEFAQEAAAARREAARLRMQNTQLQTRHAELEARPRRHGHSQYQPKESHP